MSVFYLMPLCFYFRVWEKMVDLLLSGDRQSAYGHGFFSLKELSNYNIVT